MVNNSFMDTSSGTEMFDQTTKGKEKTCSLSPSITPYAYNNNGIPSISTLLENINKFRSQPEKLMEQKTRQMDEEEFKNHVMKYDSLSSELEDSSHMDEEDEDIDDVEDMEESEGKSITPGDHNSSSGKKKRILRRCLEVFENLKVSEEKKTKAMILMNKHIEGISDIKLKKKSHRALAVGVAVLALRELGIKIDVKETSKMIPRTDRHHKSTSSTKAAEKSEAICISRLASSLSNENKKREDHDHEKATRYATIQLIEKLKLDTQQASRALELASHSEDTSLASRHAQSIAAAAVCLATQLQISVSDVVKASEISATTVRKTITALKSLKV